MDTKQKYVRLKQYNSIIIFPTIIEHSSFKHLEPISAGFCYLDVDNVVKCFGKSVSLDLDSMEDDSELATKQIFGYEAVINMKK